MYKIILHPTDLQENHYAMCEKALKIARAFNAQLFLLHVIEPPPLLQLAQGLGFAEFDKPQKEDAETVLRVLGESFGIPTAQQLVEVGSIKEHVLRLIKSLNCDLIIIGAHSTTKLPAFLGSTAHAVVHRATCDVLTLRADGGVS